MRIKKSILGKKKTCKKKTKAKKKLITCCYSEYPKRFRVFYNSNSQCFFKKKTT
jgi:hypothetical protein